MARREELPSCDMPPADAGRVYRPAHPLLGIAFLYAVSETLLWGARAGGAAAVVRSGVAHVGLIACLIGAVHFLEGVELRHVLGKLGALRAPRAGAGVAAAVSSLPAWIAVGRGVALRVPDLALQKGLLAAILEAAVAAAWQEGFCRGFVFRALMRRHGFVFSAGVAAALLAGDSVLLGVERGAGLGGIAERGLLELPLSFSLCSLFWLGQSLWPGVLVRFAVLAAAAVTGAAWPAGAAAVLLMAGSRMRRGASGPAA